MNTFSMYGIAVCFGLVVSVLPASSQAELITNGGFESGFNGWTIADQPGSDGGFQVQTGTVSPINGLAVAVPPEGAAAAMTDAGAGGSHVLYQDFVVPFGVTGASLGFSLYLNNSAENYYNPGHLDWAVTGTPGSTNLNQQARVDILAASSDLFSTAVLLNVFQTKAGDPLVAGYLPFSIDVTVLLQAHPGETLRLRFAEVDNVNLFNFGLDGVSLVSQVPLPSALWLGLTGFLGLLWIGRRGGQAAF